MTHPFARHWRRIALTLVPLVLGLLHAIGVVPLGVLSNLDNLVYDARLRATMPRTLDERIVIVDIDEASLAEVGHWPWSRNKLAELTQEILSRQQALLLGFDVVFAEADDSSGLKRMQTLAQQELGGIPEFQTQLARLSKDLDYDALFAKAMDDKPVVLGYYFTHDGQARRSGVIPKPVVGAEAFAGRSTKIVDWTGYGANLGDLAAAAPQAGFFNAMTEPDGVVRALPLLARFQGQYYESLSLAMFRRWVGMPQVEPRFSNEKFLSAMQQQLESVVLRQGSTQLAIPVDSRVAALIPFRGEGGPRAGSFRYISAADVLAHRIPARSLRGKIVLLGTTTPGLLDLRVTPVGAAYPGVETHANLMAGLMDGRVLVKPDYADGFEVTLLVVVGLALALCLPFLSASQAVAFSLAVIAAVIGLNFWLYLGFGLVMPLASIVVMGAAAFVLNMSFGYFVESRSKRQLAELFGTYVPPELVDEMLTDPDRYSMTATTRELTVMFCDMRGFTAMSETMAPTQLQALLNGVFSRLTDVIRRNRGTIDKYMGDCVMAFWGAPVETREHAALAVKAAIEMTQAMQLLNIERREKGLPEISMGIGLNTGTMCVGDMGSHDRRSYTVVGDAVNLGSRLEGLSKTYGVEIVASASTRHQAPGFTWQELDRVSVKGKGHADAIYSPRVRQAPTTQIPHPQVAESAELALWAEALRAYRLQQWDACSALLLQLQSLNAEKYLYQLYAQRVGSMRGQFVDENWDGTTRFQTK